ncbi:MAG: hypothetical protein QOF40_3216 [Actinomycetota bacterium]|nr:hypothetical protein [Actinomycetota bacterium]
MRRHFGHHFQMPKLREGMDRRVWQGVAALAGTAAATAVRQIAVMAWKTTKHEDPPENPVAGDVRWRDALTWAIALGVGAAVARVVAQRGAAKAWERATGNPPPIVS